ncbi:YihY/virulence factor BrkB family protein [Haliangium sp.]|uniref:YihY/virulence factor BrkB family protein n=1 Tax=Haliangium sp. TaxID=2663208 RepID=UPI003D14F262
MTDPRRSSDSLLTRLGKLVRLIWDLEALTRRVDTYRGRSGVRAFAVRQVEALILTSRSLVDEELLRRAAALTYYSLLSLVPLLAVGFALFEAFGGLRKLKEPLKAFIVDTLAAGRPDEIGTWLDQFIDNINAGAIAGVGVLVLIYSALGLLTNIEASFNRIWGIERGRPLHMRFAIYWCVVTLAPPLLGISISFSAQLQSSEFAGMVLSWLPFGLGGVVVALGSALVVSVAFVLSFIIVPNTKVRLKSALLGGVVTSVLWNLSKALFIWFTAGSVKYSAIYGALGALPLLMMWLYLNWVIVLFGVTYTRFNQTFTAERLQSAPQLSEQARERLAALTLLEVARAFRDGDGPLRPETLAERLGAPVTALFPLLRALTLHRVLIETEGGEERGYVPGRDLSKLTLADAVDALRYDGELLRDLHEDDPDEPATDENEHVRDARALLLESERAAHTILAGRDLRALLGAEDDEPDEAVRARAGGEAA